MWTPRSARGMAKILCLFVLAILATVSTGSSSSSATLWGFRGGASAKRNAVGAYRDLSRFLMERLDDSASDVDVEEALIAIASSQATFKGLDGAAHEAYQRTHSRSDEIMDTSVSGRAQRAAMRIGAAAEAFLACELIEAVENPSVQDEQTFQDKEILLNITADDRINGISLDGHSNLSLLVMFEEDYNGGSGLNHGDVSHLLDTQQHSQHDEGRSHTIGRVLVVIHDGDSTSLEDSLGILAEKPLRVRLSSGLVTDEVASVQPTLYKAASNLVERLEPILREEKYNTSAIHFVGHSLSGGVASLAACILDGTLPFPKGSKSASKKRRRTKKSKADTSILTEPSTNATESSNSTETALEPLNGLGRGRTSSLSLGAPPCLSSNVIGAFCTSFLYGDDVVARSTLDTINTLCSRVSKKLNAGMFEKNMGWMTDAVSITAASVRSHAHGSEGEEIRLSIPGRAYLIRPRRLGNQCSIHEIGSMKKGGREAVRASLLFQLNDILVSKSMWKHHQLESYIQGLDRVHLRGVGEEDDGDNLQTW